MKRLIIFLLIGIFLIIACGKKEKEKTKEIPEGKVDIKIYTIQQVPFSKILSDLEKIKDVNFNVSLKNIDIPEPKSMDKVAFDLGLGVADALVSVKAKNQTVLKKLVKQLLHYAELLGVSEEFMKMADSTKILMQKSEWRKIEKTLEKSQAVIMDELYNLDNFDSVILTQFGGWIRGLQDVTIILLENKFQPEYTSILANKSVINAMLHDLPNISDEELLNKEYYQNSLFKVSEIKDIVFSAKDGLFTKEQVQKLNKLSSEIVNLFTK